MHPRLFIKLVHPLNNMAWVSSRVHTFIYGLFVEPSLAVGWSALLVVPEVLKLPPTSSFQVSIVLWVLWPGSAPTLSDTPPPVAQVPYSITPPYPHLCVS